jgi:hypothetical protein
VASRFVEKEDAVHHVARLASIALLVALARPARADVIILEKRTWPPLASVEGGCKTIKHTLSGPGRLSIRLKMAPFHGRLFPTRREDVVQHNAGDFYEKTISHTVNGGDPGANYDGKPVDRIIAYRVREGKHGFSITFCNPVRCNANNCSQPAATGTLIVDYVGDGATAAATPSPAAGITGTWRSTDRSWGDLVLTQSGRAVTGRYKNTKGSILATLQGKTITGYWIEERSKKRCAVARNGSMHWGRLQLTFDGRSYRGAWGYCDEAPHFGWDGVRK